MLKKIAIVQPNFNVYSETFIRNHVRYLGQYAEVHDLAGGWVPTHANAKPLVPSWLVFVEKAVAKLRGRAFLQGLIARRVGRYLKENGIEMVLCEYGPSGVAMMPICERLGIPFAVHFFGLDLHGNKLQAQYGAAYRVMFQKANLIVAISTLQQRIIEGMGCPTAKIRHIVCGADRTYIPPTVPATKPPVFLAVGRMVEKKAPLLLLQSFLEVVREFPEARLDYVGDGPLMASCKAFVSANGLADSVTFLSSQTPESIAKRLQSALAFVQHSITAADGDSEGTPVAVLDAGLAAVPVVSTRHAGIADTVLDGVTGLLVEERDVAGMAENMKKLLRYPELAHQMAKNAHAHVRENYTVEVTVGKLWIALNDSVRQV
jgi:colanic acid/amylovoran biosynthesis glycosyltransferase